MAVATDDLSLNPAGLRFTDPATEADYARWRVRHTLPTIRSGQIAAIVAWTSVLTAIYFGVPERFAQAVRWVVVGMFPMHFGAIAATYRPSVQRLAMPITGVNNAGAGFMAIALSLVITRSLGVVAGSTTLVVYFALTIFRMPPLLGIAAVIPYVVYAVYLLVDGFMQGTLDRAEFTGYLILPATATVSGFVVCAAMERTTRETYRNERIIERQQQALDEERANLSKFLSPEVSRMVKERGIEGTLIQHTLPITVVCSDLRGFTAYTERFGAGLMATVLREYYDTVVTVAKNYDGTVKDFAGDGALILVGAPVSRPDHAEAGLALARDLATSCAQLVARYNTPEAPLGIGIGVATGMCAVGAIGSQNRFEYTAVGHAVNLAARLCAAATHGQILVCPTTAAASPQSHAPRQAMRFKGFDEEVTVTIEQGI